MPDTPNNGPTHGRFRNTMKNLYGDVRRADAFPLGPADQMAQGIQKRNLWFQHRVAKASLKQQAAMLKAQYKYQRRGALDEGRAALSDVSGGMADRGLVGSSVHQAQRQGVIGATQQGIGDLRMERDIGLMDVNMQRLQEIAALRMGLGELAMQKAAAQRQMALAAFASGGQNPWGY